MTARMLIDGEWMVREPAWSIRRPFDGSIIGEGLEATDVDLDTVLDSATRGAKEMRTLTPSRRAEILLRAATSLDARIEEFAQVISDEMGKPISEARAEAARTPDLLRLCATEGAQMRGETLPVDTPAGPSSRLGLTLRIPSGVVLAITPFNYPLLLVVHKIGPALAGGNAVILKPATAAPSAGLLLADVLLDAGLPGRALQVVTGDGRRIGPRLAADPRVRRISFTGSTGSGMALARAGAGKPMSLELGSVCPVVVAADADIDQASSAIAGAGYVNAGQVCISTQRVIVAESCADRLTDAVASKVAEIVVGDPRSGSTRLGPLVSEASAERILQVIDDAVGRGARVVTGGERDRAVLTPLVVANVTSDTALAQEELFGPAVAITAVSTFDEAIAQVNDNRYGLAAGIFTNDMSKALRFAHEAEYGMVQVNAVPTWRSDPMPYGGLKDSGFGREGPRYALAEMTETKTVVFHGG